MGVKGIGDRGDVGRLRRFTSGLTFPVEASYWRGLLVELGHPFKSRTHIYMRCDRVG